MVVGVIAAGLGGCAGEAIPVGATLEDGQVLVGEIATPILRLEGALGAIDVPLDDVGLLVPVEGSTLGASHGNIDVWLRNGSELKGKWAEPSLEMAIAVGHGEVSVAVPTEDLVALQLRGSEEWPGEVYRVRTTHGDDFLVDPASTQVHLENALGKFAPFLAECTSIGPVGANDGDWRVELHTGTVLVGKVTEDRLAFQLPMGPDRVEVPLSALVSLTRGGWTPRDSLMPVAATPAEAAAVQLGYATGGGGGGQAPPKAAEQAARPALSSEGGWFDNRRMYDAKH